MRLQEQLKFYLEKLDMSGSQLSRKSGVPNATLAEWLRGRQPRNIGHVKKLAEFLGTTIDNLLYGTGDGVNDLGGKMTDRALEALMGEEWIGGCFEVQVRRVIKRP